MTCSHWRSIFCDHLVVLNCWSHSRYKAKLSIATSTNCILGFADNYYTPPAWKIYTIFGIQCGRMLASHLPFSRNKEKKLEGTQCFFWVSVQSAIFAVSGKR
ncbi:hypothetical protein ACQKWADRAFT_298984 [Trichoderma austrokoningii]